MKILNRADFLKLPAGTLYAYGQKWYFNGLCVKGSTFEYRGDDFNYINLIDIDANDSSEWVDRLEEILEKGTSYSLDNEAYGRDGMAGTDRLFIVLEKEDLIKLRDRIDDAIKLT